MKINYRIRAEWKIGHSQQRFDRFEQIINIYNASSLIKLKSFCRNSRTNGRHFVNASFEMRNKKKRSLQLQCKQIETGFHWIWNIGWRIYFDSNHNSLMGKNDEIKTTRKESERKKHTENIIEFLWLIQTNCDTTVMNLNPVNRNSGKCETEKAKKKEKQRWNP